MKILLLYLTSFLKSLEGTKQLTPETWAKTRRAQLISILKLRKINFCNFYILIVFFSFFVNQRTNFMLNFCVGSKDWCTKIYKLQELKGLTWAQKGSLGLIGLTEICRGLLVLIFCAKMSFVTFSGLTRARQKSSPWFNTGSLKIARDHRGSKDLTRAHRGSLGLFFWAKMSIALKVWKLINVYRGTIPKLGVNNRMFIELPVCWNLTTLLTTPLSTS